MEQAKLGAIGLFMALFLTIGATGSIAAETLETVWEKGYQYSRELRAARARLQAVSEGVPQAEAGLLPLVEFEAYGGGSRSRTDLGRGTIRHRKTGPASISLSIVQPIYHGGRLTASVEQAQAEAASQIETYRNIELSVMFDIAAAYVEVLRTRRILHIRSDEIRYIKSVVSAERARVDSGQGLRSELALVRARLAAARGAESAARSRLASASSQFRRLVGTKPGDLAPINFASRSFPSSLEQMYALARKSHPAILAAGHTVTAVSLARTSNHGGLGERVDLVGTASRSWDQDGAVSTDEFEVGLRLRVPLFSGGRRKSELREAEDLIEEARFQREAVAHQVEANVEIAWGDYVWANEARRVADQQLAQQRIALQGVVDEEKLDLRSNLDVLNARNELALAQLNKANAISDAQLAAFRVLGSIGRLNARSLGLGVTYFDPSTSQPARLFKRAHN